MSEHDGAGDARIPPALLETLSAGDVEVRLVSHVPRHPVASAPMSGRQELAIGSLLLLVPLLLFTQLIALWPSALAATTTPRSMPTMVWLFGAAHMKLSADGALLLLVAIVGALSACAAASFRFAMYAGRDALSRRWMWSYALRPVQGAMLATVVYFVLRAGLLGGDSSQPLSAYGLAAVAGLVGLFTRQGFQKLQRVFNELWGVADPDEHLDPDPDLQLRREAEPATPSAPSPSPTTNGGDPVPRTRTNGGRPRPPASKARPRTPRTTARRPTPRVGARSSTTANGRRPSTTRATRRRR